MIVVVVSRASCIFEFELIIALKKSKRECFVTNSNSKFRKFRRTLVTFLKRKWVQSKVRIET